MNYKRIIRFFQVDMWRIDPDTLSPIRRLLFEVVKILYLAIRFFTTKRVMNQASALTY